MGDLTQRLPKDQAGLGRQWVDPTSPGFAGEDGEVLIGEVAPQTEPESPLAGRGAVARSHIAAGLAECRDDVAAETHRGRSIGPLHCQGRLDVPTAEPGNDGGRAISQGVHTTPGRYRRDSRITD